MASDCNMAGNCRCNCTWCKQHPPAHCGRHNNDCHDSCTVPPGGGSGDKQQRRNPGRRPW